MDKDKLSKYKILGEASRFDRCGYTGPLNNLNSFIYPAVGEKGRISRLFKVLLSSFCKSDCFYCINRYSRDCPRYRFEPQELSELFYAMVKKNYVDGLFLSSSIDKDANETQEQINKVAEILRKKFNYTGYIHLKILPGVDEILIKRSFLFATRISLNMEAPGSKFLKKLSPDKNFSDLLLKSLKKISDFNKGKPLSNGITSQLVVGASGERDKDILGFVYHLYRDYNLTRIYYSGFEPVLNTPLENLPPCPPLREVRLYQADVLLRKYKFSPTELIFDKNGNLILEKDPKLAWAENNPQEFPKEINSASLEELVRVPGIGKTSAKKIISIRKEKKINSPEVLNGLRIRLELSRNFLTFNGKFYPTKPKPNNQKEEQLLLWDEV